MTTTQPAAAMFYRVTEFYPDDTIRFLAIRCDADGKHTGRVDGSAPREYHAEAAQDGADAGLPEWPNPYARLA